MYLFIYFMYLTLYNPISYEHNHVYTTTQIKATKIRLNLYFLFATSILVVRVEIIPVSEMLPILSYLQLSVINYFQFGQIMLVPKLHTSQLNFLKTYINSFYRSIIFVISLLGYLWRNCITS